MQFGSLDGDNPPDPYSTCPRCYQSRAGVPLWGQKATQDRYGLAFCIEREEYPCVRTHELAKEYSGLVHDGERARGIGMERGLAEQQLRAARGCCKANSRCEPHSAPDYFCLQNVFEYHGTRGDSHLLPIGDTGDEQGIGYRNIWL